MKILFTIIRKVCLGIFSIYSINILFSIINLSIPINFYSICMSSFLGIFGLISIIILKIVI
ncbi:MAG TPA: pro-sigmaK processing inhibitor BofA family protein [Candidatus Coprovivens excrementavium]|nr:pro-sigmaK processing inhibitor BofA family protein [Candidatus Coprovivens excrementavium]